MLGLVIGIGLGVCAISIAMSRRRWHRHHHRHGFGRYSRRAARWLGEEIDATPGQMEVIEEALRELSEAMAGLRGGLGRESSVLAGILRGDIFERVSFDELAKEHIDRLEKLKELVLESFERVHAVLEPEQRARLAAILERGFGRRHAYC